MENQDGIKQRDTNSIRYPQNVDDKMEKLAKSFKRSKKELFCQMVDYFYRSKKDPADPGDEVLKKELSAGVNRILSFIKQQEKDFLLPVFTGTDVLKAAAARQIDTLGSMNKFLLSESIKTKKLIEYNERLARELKIIAAGQTEKEALKQRFSELMEYYIHQREEMGWITSPTKKEELITHVRKMIQQL